MCVCVCVCVTIFKLSYRAAGLMNRVFVNGPGDRGLIPGRIIPKTQRMRPLLHLGVVPIEREPWDHPRLQSTYLVFTTYLI